MPEIGDIRPQLRGQFYLSNFPPALVEFRAFMDGIAREL